VRALPELIEDGPLVLRRWRVADAELQGRAVVESLEHLRPWMPWIAHEPQPAAARREMLAGWERDWEAGRDVYLAVLWEGEVAGSTGLHRRRGRGTLEIGYWVHPAYVRRGIATRVARLLTDTAFSLPEIERVEIHHDKANAASGRIPAKLGYTLVAEHAGTPAAPGESGILCTWRLERPS
jgi:RimJ/RimL family protein N-acetyltransferase